MQQYQIQMRAIEGVVHSFNLSHEDLRLIRGAPFGRPFDLENYIGYLTSDHKLALSLRPAHRESVVVSYSDLCRKLTEAEVEASESSERNEGNEGNEGSETRTM